MAKKFLSDIELDAGLVDVNGNTGTSGQILSSTGTGVSWVSNVSISEASESVHITVKNTSGATITKGTPVYVTGETGNSGKIEVAPADASDDAKMPALGLLESNLADNAEGFCVQGGLLEGLSTDTIDGTSTTANDTVYIKAGGGLTMTKPTGTNFIQNIAKVARVHASNGSLVVSSILRTNDVPTPLYIDHANQRVGIGEETPSADLHINNDSTAPELRLSYLTGGGYGGGGNIRIQGASNDYVYGGINWYNGNDRDGAIIYSAAIRAMTFIANERDISGNGFFRFYEHNTEVAEISATGIYGNVFYDQGDTNYYLDPAGSSSLNTINVTTINRNPTVTLSGDVSGSATMTNLGSINITTTVADDSHTHDGRYYTETESDSRFVNVTGDTMTGTLNIGAASTDGAGIHLIYSTTVPEIRIQAGENGASAFSIYNTATSPDSEQFFINNTLSTSHLGNARGALKLETSSGVVLTLNGTATTLAGDLTVSGGDIILSGTGRIQGVDTVSVNTDAANKLYVDNAVAGVSYTHPTHPGDDINLDTGALTGATVISDLDFNITTDTLGHVTDANATYSTRNLTASDIGAAASSHNHDDRYYTESEMQTFFNRGYISAQSATNLAIGWYTIATNTGNRALGEFQIWDVASSRHQSVLFNASHHYGEDNSNDITVLANSRFGTDVFRYLRIKEGGTYDGAALQVYIDNSTNSVNVAITGANAQSSGWVLKDWIADATDPGDVDNYSSFTSKCQVDLDNTRDGGLETTGKFFAQNTITSNSGIYAPILYDSDNTNYYVNPASTSELNVLNLAGDITANGSILGGGNLFLRSYNNDPKGIFFRDGFEYGDTNQYNLSITIHDDGDGSADGMNINAYDGIYFNVQSGTTPNTKFRVLNTEVRAYADLYTSGDLTVSGGDIVLEGTGRIQGIDTVSAGTDAANKTYVDNAVAGVAYTHPTHPGDDFSVDTGALTGAVVVSDIDINVTTDTLGHVTDANGTVSTRTLTLADLGYTGDTNANNYTHPTHPGDDINLDTGALTGATVISDLDFNITTDTLGHVTDANATYSTRNLTASDIGAAASSHNHDSLYVNVTGDTMTGALTASGGINGLTLSNGISGSNFNITGVNQITINDPGEGILFGGGANNVTLYAIDDSTDNKMNFGGASELQVNGSKVFHDGYHPNADKWTTARTITLAGELSGAVSIDGSSNATLTASLDAAVVKRRGTITSEDWNTFIDGTEAGWYQVNNMTGSNKPPAYTYGTELNFSTASANKLQIYAPDNGTDGNGIWIRTGWNAGYDTWREIPLYGMAPYSGGDLRASIFYDSNDTNYYLNPASTSELNVLNLAGDLSVGGGDIVLSGTGRIQGIDTVSAGTDAANKTYVDNAVAGVSYTHPTHPGDDINLDTGALTGATVISDLDFNITTDTLGHVTDANATYSTRNLTASDLGIASTELVKNYQNVNYVASDPTSSGSRTNYGVGVTVYEGYSGGSNRPHTYDATVQFMPTSGQGFELSASWISTTTTPLKIRSLRDCCNGWSPWVDVAVSGTTSSGTFSTTGDYRAPIFYDSDNTAYYLNPASTGTSATFAGNVGIGTTSPGAKLTVVDDILLTGSSPSLTLTDATSSFVIKTNTAGEGIVQTSGTSKPIRFLRNNGSNESMRIDGSGNVGIGTTSPDTKLHVEGNLLVDAYTEGEDNGIFLREGFLTIDQPSITVWDMSNSGASPDGLSINAQDGIRFRENGGEVARFQDGNFGIGTTSPSEKLDVAGSIKSTETIWTGYDSGVTNSVSCSNWFRSSGDTGWYNATHAGGIYMTDGTWVRVYNNKKFYNQNNIESGSSMHAPIFYDRVNTGYFFNGDAAKDGVDLVTGGNYAINVLGTISGGHRKHGNLETPEMQWSVGGSTDLNWKKLCDVVISDANYSGWGAEIEITDFSGNYGNAAYNGGELFKGALSIYHWGGSGDNTETAYANIPYEMRNYVRWMKINETGQNRYELQVKSPGNYRQLYIKVKPGIGNQVADIISYANDTNGSTSGTAYASTQTADFNHEFAGGIWTNDSRAIGWKNAYGNPSFSNYYGAITTSASLYLGGNTSTQDLFCDEVRSNSVLDKSNTAYYFDGANTGDSIRVAGDVVAYYSSDERLKDNINPIENALEKVNAISGVTFEWNEKSHKTTGKKDVGVVAQEIEAVLPELVETRTNGYKAVDYQKLTAVLIESVKELTAKVEALEAKQCNCK